MNIALWILLSIILYLIGLEHGIRYATRKIEKLTETLKQSSGSLNESVEKQQHNPTEEE